ncbi:hypothetical protein BC834DRAFT_686282 [Gloeopeniophorella convolvens]|nr:hypothetical protein BC834DRAFT_686282 [Gloeopeniophorella convolvens]
MPPSRYADSVLWGTHGFKFGAPPPLSYRPHESWTGRHFFHAHSPFYDPRLYESAIGGIHSAAAAGLVEARYLHRLIYGGLSDPARHLPAELGHAAAYEAFRHCLHHPLIYDEVQDTERQCEAVVGLAIAEAAHLHQEHERFVDPRKLQISAQSAAATAALIHSQARDRQQLGEGGVLRAPQGIHTRRSMRRTTRHYSASPTSVASTPPHTLHRRQLRPVARLTAAS